MPDFKATSVTVSRLKNTGNYENERIDITIALPEDKTAEEGVALGRAFLAKQFGETPTEKEVAAAEAIVAKSRLNAKL